MLHYARFTALSFILAPLLFVGALAALPAHAQTCGPANCTGGKVCCDGLTGAGAQCLSSCPAGAMQTWPAPSSESTGSGHGVSGGTLVNPLKAGTIPELIAVIMKGVVQIGSIILVLMLVWVGFLFVIAQGSEEKIKSARQALMWTVIGGLILLGAQAIASLIEATVTKL